MKRISSSESVIMEILWQESPLTASQIVAICNQTQKWSDKTIKTFIRRLQEKGAITAERREVYYYFPAVTKEETGRGQAKAIVDTMFGGSYSKMTAHFVDSGDLSEEDIRDLREYLAGLHEKERGAAK